MGIREEFEKNCSCLNEREPELHCFLSLQTEEARARMLWQEELLAQAGEAEARRRFPLLGMTLGVKDNLCVAGIPATCASKMLAHYVPPYTATAVERALAAGAILMGKTNLDEFAMGSSTETSCFGPTRNPWDRERVPGGSSGGSAAAVAAGTVRAALGTDSGGSVRQPAALCGVVGLKPTYGKISRHGLIAYASSFDEIGTLTRNAEDAARLLSVMEGYDGKDDSMCRETAKTDYLSALAGGAEGLRIGLPEEWLGEGLSEDVKRALLAAVERLRAAGAEIESTELPLSEYAVALYHVLSFAEASSNLGRYHGVLFGERAENGGLEEMYETTRARYLGIEVKRRILLGTFVLAGGNYDLYYRQAERVRRSLRRNYDRAFGRYDLLLGPTTATTAWKLGEKLANPMAMYLSDSYTAAANLTGLPAVSLPCGTDSQGLPVGMQLIAPAYREDLLLRAAAAWERIREND